MPNVDIIAIGKLKKGPYFELQQEYLKRMQWSLTLVEIETRYREPKAVFEEENRKILQTMDPSAFTIVMDERGEGLRSLDFAETLQKMINSGMPNFQFVIGGAEGLNDEVRNRAEFLLSFGRQTWPHMLARIMLLEQIYRAQQILAGHPYHKE